MIVVSAIVVSGQSQGSVTLKYRTVTTLENCRERTPEGEQGRCAVQWWEHSLAHLASSRSSCSLGSEAVQPWANYSSTPGLSFLVYKVEEGIPASTAPRGLMNWYGQPGAGRLQAFSGWYDYELLLGGEELTAVWAVMCVQPTILAPAKGFSPWALFRKAIRAGISEKAGYKQIMKQWMRDKKKKKKLLIKLRSFPWSASFDEVPECSLRDFQRQMFSSFSL